MKLKRRKKINDDENERIAKREKNKRKSFRKFIKSHVFRVQHKSTGNTN